MKNYRKSILKFSLVASSIMLMTSCSAQKELITAQNNSIDSLRMLRQEAIQEKERLQALNEELREETDRMEGEVALLKASILTKDKILEDKARKARIIEQWTADTEAIVSTFSAYGIAVSKQQGEFRLSIEEGLLFESGSDKINNRGEMLVDRIAEGVKAIKDATVIVEGHTDDVPVIGMDNNWDLSVDRSIAVVEEMINEYNISPEKLMVAGRGKFEPIFKNDSEALKALNRRVEFIIIPDMNALMLEIE
jgi:chemotaxis protein MotB